MKQVNYTSQLFVFLFVSISLYISCILVGSQAAPTSQSDFRYAIDNAMKDLHNSLDWKYALSYSSIEYDTIAKCNPKRGYPASLTLDTNSTQIVVCRNAGARLPWVVTSTTGYYVTVGNLLLNQLKKRYTNLEDVTIQWVDIDVSLSYFSSLGDAVNSGQCDLVIAEANLTEEREKQVDFGCSHSAGRDSVLRSTLEPERVLDTVEKLNDPTVRVGVSAGTVYTTFRDESFPNANVTIVTSVERGFEMIKNNELHAFFWSDVTVKSWIKANCEECLVYPYGESAQYPLIFAQGSTSAAQSPFIVKNSVWGSIMLVAILLIIQALM